MTEDEKALFKAVAKNDIEEVRWLLARGVDVNAKNKYCYTALMSASMYGHNDIVELLFEYGGEVDFKDVTPTTRLLEEHMEKNK